MLNVDFEGRTCATSELDKSQPGLISSVKSLLEFRISMVVGTSKCKVRVKGSTARINPAQKTFGDSHS